MKDNSAFYHFGILPRVCIHTPKEDKYSYMYIPCEKCSCGSTEWIEKGCTMILGYFPDGTPLHKDVHRCKHCNQVRMANHVGKDD